MFECVGNSFLSGALITYMLLKKGRSKRICKRTVEEGIYLTLEVTSDFTCILCIKREWKEKNGIGLLIPEQGDSQR